MKFLSRFNRKAQIDNYMIVIVFLFVFGFLSILAAYIHNSMTDAFTDAGVYTGIVAETGAKFFSAITFYDLIIIFVLAAFIIGIGLTSFRLATAPAFFIVTIIMGAFLGFVSYFFNYLFIQITSNEVFNTVIGLFPRTMLICTNLHWISLALIVVGSITLYAKKQRQEVLG